MLDDVDLCIFVFGGSAINVWLLSVMAGGREQQNI